MASDLRERARQFIGDWYKAKGPGDHEWHHVAAEFAAAIRAEAECAKNEAYAERNRLVAALAHLYPSGIARTDIPGWEPEWHGCVYIDLPTGQASWHYHDREAHLFADLPPYQGEWDGHDTATKYERLSLLKAESAPAKRLYDALSAMMYGWADDSVRTEAFAALKEAEPFIESGSQRS